MTMTPSQEADMEQEMLDRWREEHPGPLQFTRFIAGPYCRVNGGRIVRGWISFVGKPMDARRLPL